MNVFLDLSLMGALVRPHSGYAEIQKCVVCSYMSYSVFNHFLVRLVMEVKGQMIHVPESNSILFLGSPCVDKLDELMGRGLHLSDIPIHDATRDVILVGEQAKAQDGLKKRMDKLKATLERTHQALEEEKKKTVDLLYSIFPGDVAQQLWQGQQVQARKFDDVTMLFSDIVGFTAICAQCTPMQVISMLNELYTRFDHQCGFLDIYKVETIGDAYCVAAGLHRKSLCHAKPIALMALKMMELSEEVLTPDGRPIQFGETQTSHHSDLLNHEPVVTEDGVGGKPWTTVMGV
ncbi:guanylate cyclase soluble subunit alpha-2-like [Puma concolor]|uniref:guanylate cyclase n=1 Tax=Puma concolor TaxID=9696 RepID=A0A6P6I9B7_PUMCO|nr:guanylate cyclase soluble subunit alpha-2-like [Puma concolor]